MLDPEDLRRITDIVENSSQRSDAKIDSVKNDISSFKAEMHERFDVVDNDLGVVLEFAEGQDAALKQDIDDLKKRVGKLESPPPVHHNIRK
jgi:hypothetical protein